MRMATMLRANRPSALALAAAVLGGLFLTVYLPAAGRGFLKDDFGWILAARADGWTDLARAFAENVGFYRPLVTLSFSLDHALWGLNPAGYGMTNLVLCLADGALLYALAVRLHLPRPAALAGAAAWWFNFHAINMAVLWLSGRTALLLVFFALATAHALLRGRTLAAGACCLCALLSKEEAVLLPALWTAYWWIQQGLRAQAPGLRAGPGAEAPDVQAAGLQTVSRWAAAGWHRGRVVVTRTWPLWSALGIYLVLRRQSGAFSPSDAPWYYQFSFDPALLLRNVLEYADRAGTTAAIVILILALATGWRRLHVSSAERQSALLAVIWIPAAYALTVFLPVRSSLYALFPAVGSALLVAAVASAAHRADPVRFGRAATALLLLVALLLPVYYARNERWTEAADLSARTMALVGDAASTRTPGHIVLRDAPGEPVTYDAAFSSGFPAAVELFAGPGWTGEILPAGSEIPPTATMAIGLRDGTPVVLRQQTDPPSR